MSEVEPPSLRGLTSAGAEQAAPASRTPTVATVSAVVLVRRPVGCLLSIVIPGVVVLALTHVRRARFPECGRRGSDAQGPGGTVDT